MGALIAGGLLDEYVLILALEAGYGNGVRIPTAMVFTSSDRLARLSIFDELVMRSYKSGRKSGNGWSSEIRGSADAK